MRSRNIKTILAGLAILLSVLACSTLSPASPTAAPIPTDTPFPPAVTSPATALPVVTQPATAIPATTAPTVATAPSLPAVSAPSIRQLDMLDTMNGWALTDTGVVRTTDGGVTWLDATPSGFSGAAVTSPFFLNASTAWLAAGADDPTSGTLYHTTDGGANWTSATVPFGGGWLTFVDPMNGWELIGLSAGMSHQAVAIYRTSDAGVSWTRVFIDDPTVNGSSDSLPLVGDKNGISATDSTHAWVTGAQPSDNFIYVYDTQDGGATWTFQNLSIPPAYSGAMTGASLPTFFGSNAVLPVLLFANSNGTDFYFSHDSGQTWAVTTPVPQGGFLAVGSATDFYVWDGSAPLNVSHDGGQTWTILTPNINIKDDMVAMQFIGASTGWALTSDVNSHRMLYKTTDGGATWTVLIP